MRQTGNFPLNDDGDDIDDDGYYHYHYCDDNEANYERHLVEACVKLVIFPTIFIVIVIIVSIITITIVFIKIIIVIISVIIPLILLVIVKRNGPMLNSKASAKISIPFLFCKSMKCSCCVLKGQKGNEILTCSRSVSESEISNQRSGNIPDFNFIQTALVD